MVEECNIIQCWGTHFSIVMVINNNEPIVPSASASFCLPTLLRQVGLSSLFALGGTLVVHYRHSDSLPSNTVPVWACAVGFVAVLAGLVLHQVRCVPPFFWNGKMIV